MYPTFKSIKQKRGKIFWYLEVRWLKEQDPDPLVRGSVPIRTKMSQTRKTGGNWAKVVVAYCNGCQFHNLWHSDFLFHAMTTLALVFQDFSGYFSKWWVSSACRKAIFFHFNFFFVMGRSEVAKAASQTDEVESKLHGKFAFTSQNYLPSNPF